MHTELFLARQPILDGEEKIYGYELLYRPSCPIDGKIDDLHATSHTLVALLNSVDFDELLVHKKGFINVDARMLSTQILDLLPKSNFIVEVLESVDLTSAKPLLEKARESGLRLALDDYVCNEESLAHLEEFIEFFDIVKFDVLDGATDKEALPRALEIVQRSGATALAEKVETKEEYEELKSMGFTLFQGYYFAKPELHRTKAVSPAKLKILEILNIDPEQTDKVSEAIKSEPDLAVNLLRLVNSSFFALRREIASVQQAILYIGARNIRKWLLLMLYAKNEPDPDNNAVLQSVKVRADFMAKMAEVAGLDSEKAYLTGILSLVEVMLGVSKEEALAKMRFLDSEVEEALLRGSNAYAKLLAIAQSFEKGNFDELKSAATLGLEQQRLADLYCETLCNKSL